MTVTRAAGAAVILALTMGVSACRAQTPYVPVELPRPGETICGAAVCGADALEPAFLKLEATGQSGEGRFHILQIGDSHTAGDQISGQIRSRMQARFGRGGRGILPPGAPYAGYAPRQVSVEATGASRPSVSLPTGRELLMGKKAHVPSNGEDMVMFPDFMGDDDGILLFGKPCDEGVYQNLPTLRED